jgi:hypothetical protein
MAYLLPRVLIATVTYSHVKEDLEAGITPIHLHIEAEITKGIFRL